MAKMFRRRLDTKLDGHTHFYVQPGGKGITITCTEVFIFVLSALIVSVIEALYSSMFHHTFRGQCMAMAR